MYKLHMPAIDRRDKNIPIIKKLFNEVLGYTEKEIEHFISTMFLCDVAKNLTLEQAKQITEIFGDNDIQIYLKLQTDNKYLFWKSDLGIELSHNPPKSHYCDQPLVSRDHLVNPFTQKEIEREENIAKQRAKEIIRANTIPTITCPYCKSTDCKKISARSKAVNVLFRGIYAIGYTNKQWHCNTCKSDF